MNKIKIGDKVKITKGSYKGRIAEVVNVFQDACVVHFEEHASFWNQFYFNSSLCLDESSREE